METEGAPAPRYELRIAGRLSAPLRQAFAEFEVLDDATGTRVIAAIADTATLDRIMDRIESLGLRLMELRRLPD